MQARKFSSALTSIRGRTFAVCFALASFLWLLRTMEEDRQVTYVFAIELVGAEANTGLQAVLIDSIARAQVVVSPWDHLLGRWLPNREPVRLLVEGLRTPRTEVPSAQLAIEIENRMGSSARVEQITPATLAIDVRRNPSKP
jgi:hypothetical protein